MSTPEKAETWLRKYLDTADAPGYDRMIPWLLEAYESGQFNWQKDEDGYPDYFTVYWPGWSDEYLHFTGVDAHGEINPHFWDAVSVILAKPIPDDRRPKYFSCGC